MSDGKVHKKQQVPQGGPLGDLWKELMAHSVKVKSSAGLLKRLDCRITRSHCDFI